MLSIAAPSPCYCVYSSSVPLDPGAQSVSLSEEERGQLKQVFSSVRALLSKVHGGGPFLLSLGSL